MLWKKRQSGIVIPDNSIQAPQKRVPDRYNFMYAFVGDNHTGKSTIARAKAIRWRATREYPRYKIYAHDPQDNFGDIMDEPFFAGDPDIFVRLSKLKDCLVICDDLRLLHDQDKAMKGVNEWMINRMKNNCDIIWIIHNPELCVNAFAFFTSHWFIFPVNARTDGFSRKIPVAHLCEAAMYEVNDYVALHDPRSFPPNFPHVVVTTKPEQVNAINFKIGVNNYK